MNKRIVRIAIMAFLFRFMMFVFVFEYPERVVRPDTMSYLRPAMNMIDGHGFSGSERPPFLPSAVRTPVYPFFIAGCYAMFGKNLLIIALIQVFIDTLTAALIYMWGLRLVSEPAARLGGIIYALSSEPAVHAVFILTETLFTFCLLSAMVTLSCYRVQHQRRWLLSGGILLGITILIRPIALFFPFAALLLLWMASPNKPRQFLTHGMIFLFAAVLVVTPWVMRNYWTIGLLKVSSISSYNLLFYNAVSLSADAQGISQAQARSALEERVTKELVALGWKDNESLRTQLYATWGRKILLSAPFRYLYIHLKNDMNCLLPNITDFLELIGVTQGNKGTLSVLNQQGLAAAVNHYFEKNMWLLWTILPFLAILGLIYVGAIIGIVIHILQKRWYSLMIVLLPLVYLLLLPGAASTPRFRVPAMPYICLLAGIGITAIMQRYRIRRETR